MGRNFDLVGQLKEEHCAAVGYEEDSEEEPHEYEFYDDESQDVEPGEDPIPKQDEADEEEPRAAAAAQPENEDASDVEPFEVEIYSDESINEHDSFHRTSLVSSGHSICRKRPYEVESHHNLMSDKDAMVENKSKHVQPLKKKQSKRYLKQALRHSNYVQEEVLVAKEKETKPFKKRLPVKFAADVSCYTYNAGSFAAGKLEKLRDQVDDQEKYLRNRP
jgi:polyadenylate-binding protein